ncbi:hypothetical protein MYA_0686 [Burkholderia sp. KJ006]|nr:hypothetical protein MYA_0686 [Burkholderia sp. KJ006]
MRCVHRDLSNVPSGVPGKGARVRAVRRADAALARNLA